MDTNTTSPVATSWADPNYYYTYNCNLLTLTCDRDSSTGLKLYINGSLRATADPTVYEDINFTPNHVRFNYGDGVAGHWLKLDQLRFYRGVALDASQVLAIYNGGAGSVVVESDFERITSNGAYMEFDEPNDFTPPYRYLSNGIWGDANATLDNYHLPQYFTWVLGGVPFTVFDIRADCNYIMSGESEDYGFRGTYTPTGSYWNGQPVYRKWINGLDSYAYLWYIAGYEKWHIGFDVFETIPNNSPTHAYGFETQDANILGTFSTENYYYMISFVPEGYTMECSLDSNCI
jgi:hypothetical protein